MPRKLIALGGCFGAPGIYAHMFDEVVMLRRTDDLDVIEKGDVVMYGGGEDISPSIYKEPNSKTTWAPDRPSDRDLWETDAFNRAKEVGAKNFGICRGAQLLCALSGGKLIQHVENHGHSHWIVVPKTGQKFITSSAHHQMMWPYAMPKDKFEVIAETQGPVSRVFVFNDKDIRTKVPHEPEIVWFPEFQSLGIQGHPEFMNVNAPFVHYSKSLVEEYLLKG
jgi:GMP synthase-like glutamine amidotransferase